VCVHITLSEKDSLVAKTPLHFLPFPSALNPQTFSGFIIKNNK